jgi:hypothetical protein
MRTARVRNGREDQTDFHHKQKNSERYISLAVYLMAAYFLLSAAWLQWNPQEM